MTRTAQWPRGNLPISVTRFVGRRREIAQVRARLEEARLVTLTGTGGAGKTRLAVEVAARSRRLFPAGAWLADMSLVADESGVAQAVVNALGILDRSPIPPAEKVVAHFGADQALLVLDNCEHVGDGCAAFADYLLSRTAELRILATSRRPLGLPGEHLFEVPPLSAPAPDGLANAAALGRYDAVELLIDRTSALRPEFKITEENGASVARVVAQLDGLPLAIELAASRLRSLSPGQLADRLERRLPVLSNPSPVARARQQTLRAVFDWSHSLCTGAERLLWARLSVFAGSFDLAAAEGVCAGPDLPEPEVLDVLDRLVAQSIVLSEAAGDQVRFRMLDTVREYGRDRLGPGAELTYRLRHRDYYLALARRLAAAWSGRDQAAALATLRAEHDNMREALETSMIDPAGPRAALGLVTALRQHWCLDGFLAEGREWLDRALSLPGQEDARKPGRGRIDALWVAAWVCLLQGDSAAATQRVDECDELAAASGDVRSMGFAASMRGTSELFLGNLPRALALFEAARDAFERSGEIEGLQWVLFQLGTTLAATGERDRAHVVATETLRISEELGERLWRSYALWVLGYETWLRGEPGAAATQREALAIQRAFNDPVGTGLIIETLAWIAAGDGDAERAARLLATAESVWALTGTAVAAFGPAFGAHHDECRSRIDLALGRGGMDRARHRHRYHSLAEAVATVLDESAPGAGRAGVAGPAEPSLTEREREIAGLVARGLSSRAIAGRLSISPRTVDGHVERILAKLGFSSRAQVAAWAADRLDPDDPGR